MSADCECCTGVAVETPQSVGNRAGLAAIGYRSGTYAQFLSSMLASVGTSTAHGLRTRSPDDFSIAFLDACAIVADVLTFYDERIANENYLRTATELLSIGELGRLIGYALRPGCSAAAYLAFRLNDPPANADPSSPGAASSPLTTLSSALGVIIPAGTKVQSIPGPGQMPQTFETSGDLDARWVENTLKPRRNRPYPSGSAGIDAIFLPGGGARTVGDRLLLVDDTGATALRVITALATDPARAVTRLTLDGGTAPAALPDPLAATQPAPTGDFDDSLIGEIVDGQIWDRDDLATLIARRTWSMDEVEATVNAARAAAPAGSLLSAYAVRPGAALFGHNAPLWGSLPPILRYTYTDTATGKAIKPPYQTTWEGASLTYKQGAGADDGTVDQTSYAVDGTVDLDNVYPSVAPGVTLVFVDGTTVITAQVTAARTASRTIYTMTGRVTNVTLSNASGGSIANLHPRTTAVYIQDAALALAPIPITDDIGGTSVLLDRCALHVTAGSYLAVTGERTDHTGRITVEVLQVAQATLEDGFTRLAFQQPPGGSYAIETVFFNANVVQATNGETVTEILGSGDASVAFQSFTLKQLPLSWVAAPIPGGIDAAITIRVNGIAWKRVPYLYGSAPTDRVYALSRDKSGATVVGFGDGVAFGARLPSGSENVTAVYRRGLGSAGLVGPGQLSMLVTRPPGVRDVTNPLAANGAADPETVAQSRVNAPFAVRTLDRIVTLDDYADFVRSSAAVAKARVDVGWRGAQRVIILTVAGPEGAPVVEGSPQYTDLLTALDDAAESDYPIALEGYRPRSFSVAAALVTDPAYVLATVYAAVQAALLAAFSFDARAFGQPVFRSEVIAAMQSVAGVVAVNLTAFDYTEASPAGLQDHLDAQGAALSGGDAVGAELLTIDPIPAFLTVLS